MDYKIAHFTRENERAIFKTDWENKLWLQPDSSWSNRMDSARRFFHEDVATWALLQIRMKWEPEIKTPEREKQSWSELSSD